MPSTAAVATELFKFQLTSYPNAPNPSQIEGCVRVWVDDLWQLTDPDFAAACRAYRSSPDEADRWWPTPGRIMAHSAFGKAAKFLGSEPDASRAFVDFRRRLGSLGPALSRSIPAKSLDPNDAYRNDAMFTALDACGGAAKWGAMDLSHPATVKEWQARWTATYVAEREKQRADVHAVGQVARRLMASVETSQRRIGVSP